MGEKHRHKVVTVGLKECHVSLCMFTERSKHSGVWSCTGCVNVRCTVQLCATQQGDRSNKSGRQQERKNHIHKNVLGGWGAMVMREGASGY